MANLTAIPQCGLACLVSSLSSSSCAPADNACLCADKGFVDVVASCVVSNCTVKEALIVKNETWVGCGFPDSDQKTTILVLDILLFGFQTIFFFLRMLSRAFRIAPWGIDDTTIVIAFIVTTAFLGASVTQEKNGLGRNVWTLTADQITSFLQVFLIFEMLYTFVLALIKISICFLYLRLFPGPRFKAAVWATQAFNLSVLVAFLVTDMLQCRPLSFFWTGWDGEHHGSCVNINAIAWAHASINIVLDLWLLALPASQVWTLNMALRRKVGVLLMFGFGVFLTIVSIVRLRSLFGFSNTANPTSDLFGVSIWSSIEITAGLMVACMPAARHVVLRCISRTTRSSRPSESNLLYLAPGDGGGKRAGGHDRNRLHKATKGGGTGRSHMTSLGGSDLDRNRRYSMRVTVTSTGRIGSWPGLAGPSPDRKDSPIELTSFDDDFPEPRRAALSRPGEYLGVPERLLTGTWARTQIWVRQDFSVTRSSGRLSRWTDSIASDAEK